MTSIFQGEQMLNTSTTIMIIERILPLLPHSETLFDPVKLPLSHELPSGSCAGCRALSLENLRRAPSVSLRENFERLDFLEHFREYVKTPPIRLDFESIRCAHTSCQLCALILGEIHRKDVNIDETLWAYRCPDLEEKIESIWIYHANVKHAVLKIYCHATEGSYASKYVAYRPISPPGSEETIRRIQNWIQDCSANHDACQLALSGSLLDYVPVLPTRILDVQDFPNSLRLVFSDGMKDRYAALSHCWGGKLKQRTTEETLVQHQEKIPCEELPETIRNAAFVTKALAIRYLWVDCFCIIQENEVDFHRESQKMASVYQNAFVTIAATSAKDGTGGIFTRFPKESYVKAPCDPENCNLGHMYLALQQKPHETIFEAPLNRRGWVLQEHLFARRTLHFASSQVYWECFDKFVGEDKTEVDGDADMAFPNRSFLCGVLDVVRHFKRKLNSRCSNQMNKFVDIYSVWAQLIRYYSTRELTNPSDKLPAILSLGLELHEVLGPPFEYHVGFLRGPPYVELQGLLWRAKQGALLRKPAERRIPSWSWASLDGAIDFVDLIHNHGRTMWYFGDLWQPCDKDLVILGIEDLRSSITSCQALLLEGVALQCFGSADMHSGPSSQHIDHPLPLIYNAEGDCITGELHYDLTSGIANELWLIPVFTRWRDEAAKSPVYYCLMVKEAIGYPLKGRVFERVGAGMVFDVKWFCKCESGLMAIV